MPRAFLKLLFGTTLYKVSNLEPKRVARWKFSKMKFKSSIFLLNVRQLLFQINKKKSKSENQPRKFISTSSVFLQRTELKILIFGAEIENGMFIYIHRQSLYPLDIYSLIKISLPTWATYTGERMVGKENIYVFTRTGVEWRIENKYQQDQSDFHGNFL